MDHFLIVTLPLLWLVSIACCWLGWQLLRQNGRVLLRLDEIEKRLEELEFGEPGGDRGQESGDRTQDTGGGEQESGVDPNRFGNRSLARSRIKRDGLKAGTSAPSFRLPRLDGGLLSLEELRGHRVLLVFSDPHCGPCNALAPDLERFHRANAQISVVMISRGEPKENRAKVKEHGLTFDVLLQQQWEISRLYAMFATPMAYLIDESGIIVHDVAVGVDAILALMQKANGALSEFAEGARARHDPDLLPNG